MGGHGANENQDKIGGISSLLSHKISQTKLIGDTHESLVGNWGACKKKRLASIFSAVGHLAAKRSGSPKHS